jgi:hypothetical protein
MATAEMRHVNVARAHVAHPEEWLSILTALVSTLGSVAFFWGAPSFEPESGLAWTIPGWLAFAYLFFQILFLLVSATQVRALGVLDSVVAIFPFIAGMVTIIEWILGRLPFSTFQLNAVATMLAAGLGEFLLTVWIRFVVNRRTIGIEAS